MSGSRWGWDHQQLRARVKTQVDMDGFVCWRCARAFPPGATFDLGHADDDRSRYMGPECVACNRATRTTGRATAARAERTIAARTGRPMRARWIVDEAP